MEQTEEEEPTPREAEAHESKEAGVPLVAEATEADAKATEAEALRASEAEAAGAGAPRATEVEVAEARLEKEVSRAAEASVAVQAVLEAKIGEHNTLQSATRTVCKALEVEGVESAVVSSHYADVDLEAISDGYVLAEDDEEANEEVTKLMEAAESPGTALAKLFEEEVVPPTPSIDAGDPEP
ncbi:uncharacterized protein [Miscanthus floridulus]|uniref:uncharacterized protein n=1 Tax=Miscanthus floridulus TaxID=154761 RepID=UPI0034590EE3